MKTKPIACNLAVFDVATRKRYDALIGRLRSSIVAAEELDDGFAFQLPIEGPAIQMAAEFMSMERLCCPFLELELHVKGNSPASLRLRGGEMVKEFLQLEFGDLPDLESA